MSLFSHQFFLLQHSQPSDNIFQFQLTLSYSRFNFQIFLIEIWSLFDIQGEIRNDLILPIELELVPQQQVSQQLDLPT